MKNHLSPIENIIADAKAGKMFILVDAEDRENEGDLVIPAIDASPEVINFMAKYGRGLVCLPLSEEKANHLNLKLMSDDNKSRHKTPFTVSIEAKEGITTGISAKDRSTTIQTAINPEAREEDLVTPGHIFPLKAKDGGVLVRAGHTEAAVDISRLAGKDPSAVICEIMNDDGTMARLPELIEFAKFHDLKIGTISDLINYRIRNDHIISNVLTKEIEIPNFGKWICTVYKNNIDNSEHIAFVKGDISQNEITPVRVHVVNVFQDLVGIESSRENLIYKGFKKINDLEFGVLIFIRDTDQNVISNNLKKINSNDSSKEIELREYGIGAQILLDIGVRNIKLISNSKSTLLNIEGYNLEITERIPLVD